MLLPSLLLIGLASPALALPSVIGGFVLRRFRWITPVLALAVPAALWLASARERPNAYILVMVVAAGLWAWAGRRFGLYWMRRGLGKGRGDS